MKVLDVWEDLDKSFNKAKKLGEIGTSNRNSYLANLTGYNPKTGEHYISLLETVIQKEFVNLSAKDKERATTALHNMQMVKTVLKKDGCVVVGKSFLDYLNKAKNIVVEDTAAMRNEEQFREIVMQLLGNAAVSLNPLLLEYTGKALSLPDYINRFGTFELVSVVGALDAVQHVVKQDLDAGIKCISSNEELEELLSSENPADMTAQMAYASAKRVTKNNIRNIILVAEQSYEIPAGPKGGAGNLGYITGTEKGFEVLRRKNKGVDVMYSVEGSSVLVYV